jgi:acyl-coenzyme A synthetase/AMP-(fatty) acid ligase
MLGVLYSDNYYTVVDTKTPIERLRSIVNDFSPALIISGRECPPVIDEIAVSIPVLVMDYSKIELSEAIADTTSIGTDLAFVTYTSGSTGNPKGVIATHGMMLDAIEVLIRTYEIDESDVFGSLAPFCFILSVQDIFAVLYCGAQTVIIPEGIMLDPMGFARFLEQNRITGAIWPSSAFSFMYDIGFLDKSVIPLLSGLRKIGFGGGAIPPKIINAFRQALPHTRFINAYGSTEIMLCCSYVVDRILEDAEAVPVGRACSNRSFLLLDEDMNSVKEGEIGELYIRGIVSGGYYKDNENTSRVFLRNPLNEDYPELIYKTGDLAKINERGELVIVGRSDLMFKHNGYRIASEEVESSVERCPGVTKACCIFDKNNDLIIIFYTGKATEPEIMSTCSKWLPHYMMPQRLVRMEELPHTKNGKIDRQKIRTLVTG